MLAEITGMMAPRLAVRAFHRPVGGLTRTAIRNVAAYAAELLGRGQLNSLLDTAVLQRTLEKKVNWDQLRDNLDAVRAGLTARAS